MIAVGIIIADLKLKVSNLQCNRIMKQCQQKLIAVLILVNHIRLKFFIELMFCKYSILESLKCVHFVK